MNITILKPYTILHFILYGLTCLCLLLQQSSWALYEPVPESYYVHQKNINTVSFEENTTSYLAGQWQFYPKQFLQTATPAIPSETVILPISFKELGYPQDTYGTFVGHFKIPEEYIGRRIGIWIPNQYGAYRMYLNGDLLLRLGEVGTTNQTHQTENAPRFAYFIAENEYFTVTMQVSSFQSLHGGLENPMRIGLGKTINRQFQQLMMSIAGVCGAVIGVGIFTILFGFFRGVKNSQSQGFLVFGIFIIFLALHNLFSAPYVYTVFTNIDWLWGTRLEYIFTYLSALFFINYMFLLNRRYLHPAIYAFAVFVLSFDIVITCLSMPNVFERLAFYSFLFGIIVVLNFAYGFYLTLKRHEHYSSINLWAVVLLCVTFLHDFLLSLNWIDSINLSFASTSFYAFLIMVQQSKSYVYHSDRIEKLNNNLLELNSSLDQKVKERTVQLSELNEKLELQAQTDVLTGAFNRRALNTEIQRQFNETSQQHNAVLAFAMLDVDYFKNYNDYYGHLKGDEILQQLVQVVQNNLPEHAYLARYGGEEFAVIIRNMPVVVVEQTLQHLLHIIRQQQFEHLNRGDQKQYVTISIGAAYMDRKHQYHDIHALMKAADQQLYLAKNAGRDQLKI